MTSSFALAGRHQPRPHPGNRRQWDSLRTATHANLRAMGRIVGLVVVVWVYARPATAQDTNARTEEARQLFRQGVSAARGENWQLALTRFQAAYERAPRSAILLNIATAQAQTGRPVDAASSYERYLAALGRDARGQRGAQARAALEQVRSQIATLQVELEQGLPGDEIRVGGQVFTPQVAARGVSLNPGSPEVCWQPFCTQSGESGCCGGAAGGNEGAHSSQRKTPLRPGV